MIDQLKEVLTELAPIKEGNYLARIEFKIIQSVIKHLEWAELSPAEKQAQRKSMLQSIKKYHEEDGLQSFDNENAVVFFYDLGISLIRQIEMQKKDYLSIKRLRVLLLLDLAEIDRSFSLYGKKLIPYEVYINVESELLKDGVNLSGLNKLIDLLKIIKSAENEFKG